MDQVGAEQTSQPVDADTAQPPAPPPPLTALRLRLDIDTGVGKPPIRFWYQPTQLCQTFNDFATLLADDVPILREHRHTMVLSMDGFALLPNAPTTILRDSDAMQINATGRLMRATSQQQMQQSVPGTEAAYRGMQPAGASYAEGDAGAGDSRMHSPDDGGVKREAEGLLELGAGKRRREGEGEGEGVLGNGQRPVYDVQDTDWSVMAAPSTVPYSTPAILEVAQHHAAAQLQAQHAAVLAQQHVVAQAAAAAAAGEGGLGGEAGATGLVETDLSAAIATLLPTDGRPAFESPKDLDGNTRQALRKVAVACDWKFRNLPQELQQLVQDDKLKITKGCLMEFLKNSRPKVKKP